MSILRRVLAGSLASALRRKAEDGSSGRSVADPGDRAREPLAAARQPATTASGVKVVILNWDLGENDPFSVLNATLREHFHRCGKNAEIIEISSEDWTTKLLELAPDGIEFAYTWQGFGSRAAIAETGVSLWEYLRTPLICVHGDHPCHMPSNHELENRYCFHLYLNADFARYSNRHFRRLRGASVVDLPKLHREQPLERRQGDYFVIAKNIADCDDTEALWRQRLDKRSFDAYMAAAETVKSKLALEPYVEVHDVLDELLEVQGLDWLSFRNDPASFHRYHSQLDHYLRSYRATAVVAALREFPVRICGRGWDRIACNAAARHAFEPGRNMADSQPLYYTRFGLVDISPSKGLHDRTLRAMANGTGFISSANLEDSFSDIGRFSPLFFSFRPGELADKCATVMEDPDGHQQLARQFADRYYDRHHYSGFVDRLDLLAKSVREL